LSPGGEKESHSKRKERGRSKQKSRKGKRKRGIMILGRFRQGEKYHGEEKTSTKASTAPAGGEKTNGSPWSLKGKKRPLMRT